MKRTFMYFRVSFSLFSLATVLILTKIIAARWWEASYSTHCIELFGWKCSQIGVHSWGGLLTLALDLKPCPYCLSAYGEDKVFITNNHKVSDLKEAVWKEMGSMSNEILHAVFQNFRVCIWHCLTSRAYRTYSLQCMCLSCLLKLLI